MEYWTLQEPICAAIVARDPSIPVTLVLPEANIALLAVSARSGQPDRAEELRLTELLTFCEMARAHDPDARPGAAHQKAMEIFGSRVRGKTRPEPGRRRHGCIGRSRPRAARRSPSTTCGSGSGCSVTSASRAYAPLDGVDAMVRARSVKTPEELVAVRRTGPKADAAIQFAASQVRPGLNWTELTLSVAGFMASQGITPVDEGTMLFGGCLRRRVHPGAVPHAARPSVRAGPDRHPRDAGQDRRILDRHQPTAVIGKPTPEYQALHDTVRDCYLTLLESMKPGFHTGELTAMAHEYMRGKGVPAAEKLLVFAHGVGMMPVESPVPGRRWARAGARGFTLEENMVVSVDCLFFGAKLGPCHMENVFIIGKDGPESLYKTPLELCGPR